MILIQYYWITHCKFLWGILDLQYCGYSHLPSDVSSNIQSSMRIFHHKLLTRREGRVLANGWTRPSSMTLFGQLIHKKYHPKSYHSGLKDHMTRGILFRVAFIGREGQNGNFYNSQECTCLLAIAFYSPVPNTKGHLFSLNSLRKRPLMMVWCGHCNGKERIWSPVVGGWVYYIGLTGHWRSTHFARL